MATEIDTVITRFETDASQAIAETQRMSGALEAARKASDQLPVSAAKADRAVATLGERMTAFARAERSEGRTASFFVAQLEAIAPKGSMAANALGELTQAMVGGVGLGLALGVVSMATQALVSHFQAAAKEAKAFADASVKAVEESQKRIDALRGNVSGRAGFGGTSSNAAAAARAAIMEMEKELAALSAQAAKKPSDELATGIAEIERKIRAARVELTQIRIIQGGAEVAEFNAKSKAQRDKEVEDAKAFERDRRAEDKRSREQAAKDKVKADADEWAAAWGFQVEAASRLTAAEKAADEEKKAERERAIRELAEMDQAAAEAALALEDDRITGELEMERQANAERIRMQQEFASFAQDAARGLAQDFMSQFRPVLTTSAAYERAMKAQGKASQSSADLSAAAFAAMTQNALASVSTQAAVKALWEVAEGIAAYARYDPASGSLHMQSAAQYAIVAGVAGVAAYGIGQTRGMTRAERDSLAGMESSASTGARSGGSSAVGSGGTQTITKTETVFVIGDPFESPAETARRAARAMELARRLDLVRRTG